MTSNFKTFKQGGRRHNGIKERVSLMHWFDFIGISQKKYVCKHVFY